MIDSIKSVLTEKGEMTCLQLVSVTGKSAQELISVLRRAVDGGELSERNGFYTLPPADGTLSRRCSYKWVEGAVLPKWVVNLATGIRTCETVFVIAEIDSWLQQQGFPQFVPALIDVRLMHIQCWSTGRIIDAHVLRYLPLDTGAVL
ncbi:hypothetical protein QJ445_10865 [Salmonella enterica]|uniref:hypothetical protein n=1 Tax=Salmonella enterica TaxID=28901 RepID=UPI00256FE3B7|nr:hypothetical protein [Salmonella enterica]MDL4164314.1 hypothetical protein [Salmonella enterica]MDL4172957.1 hypothetical protein [Salmonella enterica]MDL4203114.1 hypothetical protein [Salmonella enterica]